MLDHYPRSYLDVAEPVQHAARYGRAMACLSVDASGTTSSHFERALNTYAKSGSSLDVIIRPRKDSLTTPLNGSDRTVWHEIEAQPGALSISACEDCRSTSHAHVVRIDEQTFLPIAEPLPKLYMPDVGQSVNAAFWELADDLDAIRPESPTANDDMSRAERTPMAIRVDFGHLMEDPERLADGLSRRISEIESGPAGSEPTRRQRTIDDFVKSSLTSFRESVAIVCAKHDVVFKDQILAVLKALGAGSETVHFGTAELDVGALDLTSGSGIGCFTLGTVTGSTLKDLRVNVADALEAAGVEAPIYGFCLHARPPSFIEWAAVRNSYRPHSCAALWLTWLPWTSALRAETKLFERTGTAGSEAIENRWQWLNEPEDSPTEGGWAETAFWGANDHFGGQQQVRGRSLYGFQIGPNSVLAAVGAAIHTARLRHEAANSAQRFMVDIPRATRSYFDALLLSAIVRCARPGEAWWGRDPDEAADTMRTLLRHGVGSGADVTVLYPEMFVTALLGKVPPSAVAVLLAEYARIKDTPVADGRFDRSRAAQAAFRGG